MVRLPTGVCIAILGLAVALFANSHAADDSPAKTSIVESGPLSFEASVIRDKFGYAYGTVAVDLDRDGDLDLTCADATDNQLMWFANDGTGHFRQHLVCDNDPGLFERHAVGDINGDDWPDIAIVKNWVGELLWFEHSGKGGDVNPWNRHVITNEFSRAYDVALADIDGDGDLDVAGSNYAGREFAWFENDGTPDDDDLWKKHLVDTDLNDTRTIACADFNGDGCIDLLGTVLGQPLVAWYESLDDNGKVVWKKHVVDDQSPNPCHGHPADMDGDGDIDIIVGLGYFDGTDKDSTHQAAWYENVGTPGDGSTFKKHFIGELYWAFEAIAVDLDGDGDIDASGSSMGNPGGIHWFENTGDPKGQWKKHPIMPTWINANQVIAADIDGDGRQDLIGTAERGSNDFRLWRNLGPTKPR